MMSERTPLMLSAQSSPPTSPSPSPSRIRAHSLSPQRSPNKSIHSNMSARDIVRLANQSVDEFLIDLESKHDIDNEIDNDNDSSFNRTSLPSLRNFSVNGGTGLNSPTTEPLHVDQSILDGIDTLSFDDDDDDDAINQDEDDEEPQQEQKQEYFLKNSHITLNGPKPVPVESPLKSSLKSPKRSPKKAVTIDDSPSKIHNYEAESEAVSSDLDSDISTSSLEVPSLNWTGISVKPFESNPLSSRLAKLPSKPLPELKPSQSDYSIQSMPNLNFVPSSPSLDSDDSDATLAASPVVNTATRMSPLEMKRPNMTKTPSSGDLSSKVNQFHYDHDHYLQDMQSGSLIEPENIKNNIVESEQLRHELKAEPMMQQNEELKNQNKLIEDFKLENDGINRSDSLKSNISISADECLLKTRIVQTPIHATEPSCEPEITMHVDTNTDDEAEEGEEKEREKEAHPLPVRAHAHKRSSSLSDFVGGIIRSFSSKTISKNEERTQIEPIRRSFSARNVSAQSVATTITDSGFVSAAEDLYNSDNSVSHINYSKHEDANKTLDTIVVDASTDDDANECEDDAEASSNYETSSVKDASFTSQDLVLQVPFEDDVFDHEYDAFNQSVQTSRNTSNSSNGARIISIERAERDEVLQIWSQQKNYKIPPRKLAEFDSIHTPIKASYVVNNTHPKAIKVLNAIHDERKISEEIASSWIYNKLEVLPGGVNRKLAHRKSLSAAGVIENVYAHDHNHIYNDAADDIQYELLSNVSGDSVVHDTTAELTGTSFNATAAELAPASAQVKAPTLVEDSTMELTVGINDDDTSLMRDIKSWDPDYSASGNSALDNSTHTIWHDALRNHHKPNQDSIDILKQVWNENKSVGGGGDDVGDHRDHNDVVGLTHSDTFERLQAGWSPRKINIESYINKRNVSDGSDIQYNVKEGMGGKAQVYQDVGNPVLPPQSASIYMYGNESFSKIVPDLGIADGLDEDGGDIYSINTGVKVSAFDATSMLEWVPASRSSQHVEPAYEAPKSPVSPARQKMIEKFEELQRQKQDMESHRRMQQKLHSKIHAEAEVMKAFYPQEEQKKHAIDEGVLLKSQQLSGDDSVGLYEEFSDSPTKIQRQDVEPMELTHPHPHASMDPDFVSGNPFESPKIRSMMKESSTFRNVGIAHNSADVESVNPFEDSTSMNFQKIASDTPTAENSVKITDSMKKKKLVMGEQGRLFLKVENVNGLKLPDMKRYNAKFQLTLDNGIHCIKTDFADIGDGNTIKINKEFELIVAEKLDIVLTLKLKYDKPLPQTIQVSEKKTVKSKGLKGKLFGKKDVQIVKKMVTKPAEEDLLSSYVASDGSFSKLKISFDDYKQQIFGKPSTYSLTCYNEWKSTKASTGVVKNYKPIAICALNMKMMFLPRISEKEVFPLSINNALSQLREMRNFAEVQHEGFLWQEGGDVQVSTRRMYKLNNYDMQAFNISNNKLKAKINIKKVVDVVSPQTGSAQGKRVISDYDGMLLNHGFRIVFANKEHIDFGCDTAAERDAWVEKIQELITVKNVKRQPWLTTMAKAMKDVPVTSMV